MSSTQLDLVPQADCTETAFLTFLLVLLIPTIHAQNGIAISTSFSIHVANGQTQTVGVPISVVAGPSGGVTSGSPQPSPVTLGAGGVTNGGVVTLGASNSNGNVVQVTAAATTTFPPAPAATIDPNSQAPFPGATQNGVQYGPGDNYIAAADRRAQLGVGALALVAGGMVVQTAWGML